VNGRRVRESTGKHTQQEAADTLAIRLGAIAKGEPVAATRAIKVQRLWERLLEYNKTKGKRTQLHHWRNLGPFFSNVAACKVDSRMLAQYRAQREATKWRGKPIAPQTVNREFTTLRRMYNVALKHTTPPLVAAAPTFDFAQEAKPRAGFVDAMDYTKLRQAAEFRGQLWLEAMVELAYRYGWRHEELVGLRVRQCNFNTRTITLDPGTTKNKDGREVVMLGRVATLLERCCKGKRPEDKVLTRSDGSPVVDPRVGWYTLCVSVGLAHWQCLSCKATSNVRGRCQCGARHWAYRGLLLHDMRRSAVRAMMRSGIDQHTAMAMTGHRTTSMFNRYHIIDHTAHVDAVAKMEHAAALEEKAALKRLVSKPQSSHKTTLADVATAQPKSSQVQ
jgi:integrase